MRKLFLLLVAVALNAYADDWTSSGNYSISWFNKTKTEFTITTNKELAGIAYLVNNGYTNFSGVTIKLNNDIDLSGKDWKPIGTDENQTFQGIFEGQNHKISGLTFAEDPEDIYIGFFGYAKDMTIKDVTFNGEMKFNVRTPYKPSRYIGGVVADGTNCTFIYVNSFIDIQYQRSETSVYTYGAHLGGLAGTLSNSKISYCKHSGNITAILGISALGASYNGGNHYIGGLVGMAMSTQIEYSENISRELYSKAAGSQYGGFNSHVGGIVGDYSSVRDRGYILCCRNVCTGLTVIYDGSQLANLYLGGIAGEITGTGVSKSIDNCYVALYSFYIGSNKTAINTYYGGIAGKTHRTDVHHANYSNYDYELNQTSINKTKGYFGSTVFSYGNMSSSTFLDELNIFPSLELGGNVWVKGKDGLPYVADLTKGVKINQDNFPDENFRRWLLGQDYGYDGILTDEEIKEITRINISDNDIQSLKGIEYFISLKEINCASNKLTSLDVSRNTALEELRCYSNKLTSLDVSKNTALKELRCYSNNLTSLDVSKNTALERLDCEKNKLTSLDVSKNTRLQYIYCYSNQLTSLDVSKNTALELFSCGDNQLASLDLSNNTELTGLYCGNNQLTSLDVSKNTRLKYIYCYSNKIKGSAMDTFIESLPVNDNGTLRVINNTEESNKITTTQVGAVKAKGWTPYYYDGSEWKEYAGYDPSESEITLKCVSYGKPTYEFIYESAWEDLQEMNPNAIGVVSSKDANWAKSQKNVLVEYINDSQTSYTCPYFELTDLTYGYNDATEVAKTGFYTPVSFKVTKGSYKRQAYAGYNTLCLPFSFKASELSSSAKVFTFDSYDADKTKVVFKSVSGTIAAGTPCIVKEKTNVVWNVNLAGKTIEAAQPSGESHMRGTYVTTDLYQGKGYSPRSSDNKFAPLTQYLHPFRACFSVSDLNDAGARGSLSAVFLDEDGATAIDEINAAGGAADDSKTIYTLSGQRINEVKRSGIYIVNGEKQYIEVK